MERAPLIGLTVVALTAAGLGIWSLANRGDVPGGAVATADVVAAVGRPFDRPRQPPIVDRASRRSALVDHLPEHDGTAPDDPHDERQGAAEADGDAASSPLVIPGQRRGGAAAPGDAGERSAAPGRGRAAESAPAVDVPSGGGDGARPASQPGAATPSAVDARRAVDAVLLSIPLQGSVEPDAGGSPTKADGVVVDGDTVEFTDEAQYTLPAAGHVNGAAGSIVFDVEPRWSGSDESNNSLLQIRDPDQWANSLQIVKNLDTLRFILVDAAGVQSEVSVGIADWQSDEPHRLAATWGDAAMTLYVDGEPVGQAPIANGPMFKPTTPIHVGSDFPGSQFGSADARIGKLTIYGRALAANEIR